jgi:hypothetical protein
MFSFKNFTEQLKTEHAVYDMDLSEFDTYMSEIDNEIETLKNFNESIKKLIDNIKNISKDEIYLNKSSNENYIIIFPIKISSLIISIQEFYLKIKINNQLLFDKINSNLLFEEELRLEFHIQIEKKFFNKFHYPIDLPKFLLNTGLGKKIILRSIDEFGYCLFTKEDDSIDLKVAVESIRNRTNDYYSFEKDSAILIFKDDFNLIKNILRKWINEFDYLDLDRDFYKKYKNEISNDVQLNDLYQQFSKKYDINLDL